METIKKFIDAFVSFYHSSDPPVQFGMILIFIVIGLLVVIYIPKGIFYLIRKIKKSRQSRSESKNNIPSNDPSSSVLNSPDDFSYLAKSNPEKRTILYLDEELGKFQSKILLIESKDLKEESTVKKSSYTSDDLSYDKYSELSEGRKKEIRKRFSNLNLRDLKKQQDIYTKKQQLSSKDIEKTDVLFRALLASRDNKQTECIDLYNQQQASFLSAREKQDKILSESKEIEQVIIKEKETLEQHTIEKKNLLEALEKNRGAINESLSSAGKVGVMAFTFSDESDKVMEDLYKKHQEDAALYLGSVSELDFINKDLLVHLNAYKKSVKQDVENAFALSCIEAELAAQKKAIEEDLARERAEKLEKERLKSEKKQAKLLSKQKQYNSNEKVEELDKRAEALKIEEAELAAQKKAIEEDLARERAEKEAQEAAAKAKKEQDEAMAKAEKAARQKAELEALEDLTEEQKEMRRRLEQVNNDFSFRSESAAAEGFVNERRLNEIDESKATLANEQAKRAAEKEALRISTEKKQQRIIENDSAVSDENSSPQERMDSLREQWRIERENKERFEEEKSRKALEIERRRKELSNSTTSS